ncbi:MAG TPA: hypothetical protein VGI92_13415, partial [Gemmatimonadales bacterium]
MIALLFQLAAGAPAANPARDSALVAFSAIAVKVAALRSGYDQYRKSAYNDGNAVVAARAADYGVRCRELAESAKQNRHYFCRSCAEQALQAALDQYRLYLPALEQLGSRCETRMERMKPSSRPTAATWSALRHEVVPENDRIVRGLRTY